VISIAALIYRSAAFADALVKSLMEFTPHLHNGRARFFFVANDATPQLLAHLDRKGYAYVRQTNTTRTDDELLKMGYAGPEYIHRVYRGYNRAIQESNEQMVLLNSDMQFSPGWLEGLEQFWNPNLVLTSTLVERWQAKFGDKNAPGAANYFIERDFGDHPSRFDAAGFYAFSKFMAKPELRQGRHYASIMLSRTKALETGLYPEGNLFAPWGVYSGDQAFFARLRANGVNHAESAASIVYHFNEGEKEDTVQTNIRSFKSMMDESFVVTH